MNNNFEEWYINNLKSIIILSILTNNEKCYETQVIDKQ